jgi:DNA-binding SARP family transcriptional activator
MTIGLESDLLPTIDRLLSGMPVYAGSNAALRVQTLGGFRVWRAGVEVQPSEWAREKAIHLFQFLISAPRHFLHKEQIIDRLWPELEAGKGDRDFKVALNSLNHALEPDREPRSEARFVHRHGLAYGLDMDQIWLDSEVLEQLITLGNQIVGLQGAEAATAEDAERAAHCYAAAVQLYQGDYLPERRYEDWSSVLRERLQVLALNTMTTLAALLIQRNPLESLRLTQRVLTMDPVWEDAYRIQMRLYVAQGNRPLALRTYNQCVQALAEEFGVEPLPETQELHAAIRAGKLGQVQCTI